jgi:copper oxidase (laccase) domain-containing protein
VHAGRRGVALGVVDAAVAVMRELGARSIWGKLGPHIGPCCYEVGADVQDEVAAALPVSRSKTRAGRPSLDLAAGLLQQLREAGVEHLSSETACTAEDPQLYSYRRDGVTGRQAGVVLVRERPGR